MLLFQNILIFENLVSILQMGLNLIFLSKILIYRIMLVLIDVKIIGNFVTWLSLWTIKSKRKIDIYEGGAL